MSAIKSKVVVVMPAYNAAKTLHMTYADLPRDMVDLVILVDDGSSDETAKLARELGLELFSASIATTATVRIRKTLLPRSLARRRLHRGDGPPRLSILADPTLLPGDHQGQSSVMVRPMSYSVRALMGVNPHELCRECRGGNIFLNRFPTIAENTVFGLRLSEYHTGYRAFRREALESVNLQMDSDKFIFDQEIVAQLVNIKMRITEVPVPTRYFAQASSASFFASTRYGLSILWLLLRYVLHRAGMIHQRQFDSLERRYRSAGEVKPQAH